MAPDSPQGPQFYEFGDFRVDVTHRLLLLKSDGRALPLSSRAFEALLFFLEHRGQLLDKSTLMKAIWPNAVVEENNLNQHVSTLRRVLGESRDDHRFIVTVPGRGYRFVAEVTTRATRTALPVVADQSALPPPLALVDDPTDSQPADRGAPERARGPDLVSDSHSPAASRFGPERVAVPESTLGAALPPEPIDQPSRSRPLLWAFGSIAIAIAAAGVLWFMLPTQRQKAPTAPMAAVVLHKAQIPVPRAQYNVRLAILPFENLSPDPANAFFADGLHEEIISTIAERVPGVDVISRTTMMSDSLKSKSIAIVARQLGATHVIEGSVRREGKRVRLTLQLIDAGTDGHLWSKSYDRTLSSALTLQTEVAGAVASQLSAKLATVSQRPGAPTKDPEAYDLYLKAVLALRRLDGGSPLEDFRNVDDLLTHAIQRDPGFALAYAQRARAGTLMFISSTDTSDARLRRISADIEAGGRLAPDEPFVQAAEGYFLMAKGDTEAALEKLNAAESGGLSDPVWLIPKTRVLFKLARIDEAVRTHERMLALDPGDPLVIVFAAIHFQAARRPAEALKVAGLMAGEDSEFRNYMRAQFDFSYLGRTQSLRSVLDAYAAKIPPALASVDPTLIESQFDLLRLEHRYADLQTYLRRVSPGPIHYTGPWYEFFDSIGEVPTAKFRGWSALLLGDKATAAREGRAVLDFVASQKQTPWNEFYLDLLSAEGELFSQHNDRAIAAAHMSLELMPRSRDALAWVGVAVAAARVYAWAGDAGDADTLLEQLASAIPGLPPADIARDPFFTMPLERDDRFRVLSSQLEAQIRTPPDVQ